jgi:dUTP pyrophosphatase
MSDKITVSVVNSGPNPLPGYATMGSSGVDLMSAEDVIIEPGETKMIRTGLAVSIPDGWEIQIRSRSGLALKKQVTVYNSPGTVDSDYIGPMNVILHNGGSDDFIIRAGDRIAQAVLSPVCKINWNLVDVLNETERGTGGFGHTGV